VIDPSQAVRLRTGRDLVRAPAVRAKQRKRLVVTLMQHATDVLKKVFAYQVKLERGGEGMCLSVVLQIGAPASVLDGCLVVTHRGAATETRGKSEEDSGEEGPHHRSSADEALQGELGCLLLAFVVLFSQTGKTEITRCDEQKESVGVLQDGKQAGCDPDNEGGEERVGIEAPVHAPELTATSHEFPFSTNSVALTLTNTLENMCTSTTNLIYES